MKKVYSLALAAVVSISAYANVDLATSKYITLSAEEMNVTTELTAAPAAQKAPAKTAIAADAVMNTYLYSCYNSSSGDDGGQHELMLTIIMNGAQSGDANGENCSLIGIFYEIPIRAVFDATAGTIRIYEQNLFMNTYYNEMVKLYTLNRETGAKIPYVEFAYTEEGKKLTYTSTGESFIAAEKGFFAELTDELVVSMDSLAPDFQSGWAWKYQNWFDNVEVIYPQAYVNTADSEWNSIGEATLTDGWLKATVNNGKGVSPYKVAVKQNKNNGNLYLLDNPYGVGTPYAAYNTLNMPGAIAFEIITEKVENMDGDMVDMTTVAVRPFLLSGYDNEDAIGMPVYCTNLEGKYYYMLDSTMEDMYYDFADLDYTMASVSADGKTLTLPNCRVQLAGQDSSLTMQWDNEAGDAIPMESTIVMPVSVSGVNGIINDAETAPARYFNLQGVEIANPEAGQLVIVKEGKKATKTIVK